MITLAASLTASGSAGFRLFDTLPVASALTVPFLLARRRLTGIFLGLSTATISAPLSGIRRCNSAGALAGMKALLASLQQTTPRARPAWQSLPPTLLIFGMTCRTLGRAQGR